MFRNIRWMGVVVTLLFATAAFPQGSENVELLLNMNDYPNHGYNDCWGYTAPDGREYALLGTEQGTSIIDITDTDAAYEVQYISSPNSLWKDIKTYQHYAYVVTESSGGMQILDLSDLPNSVSIAAVYGSLSSSHNIYIDVETGILFSEGSGSNAVRIFSLEDPTNPVELSGLGIECHDIYAQDGVLYVSEGGQGSIGIYDVSDPSDPSLITRINIPASGYAHNAWATEDGNFIVTTEETSGKTVKMWDVSDMGSIELTDDYLAADGIAHNAHNKLGYSYVSHYGDGLRIIDITDPDNIFEAGYYDTYPGPAGGFEGAWGAYPFYASGKVLISDRSTGLYVVYFAGAAEDIPFGLENVTIYSDYATPDGMALTWSDPTHLLNGDSLTADAFSVVIERDGQEVAVIDGGYGEYFDTGLNDGQMYEYELFARVDSNQTAVSVKSEATWIAGGSPVPNSVGFFNVAGSESEITIFWDSPSTNIDDTPMDDYAGVNLYRNGEFETFIERATTDTSQADAQSYSVPEPGFYAWTVTVVDNEDPANESMHSYAVGTPLEMPVSDAFETAGTPNIVFWATESVEVNEHAVDPPSPPYALNLNGHPNGEDIVDLHPLDITAIPADSIIVRYAWQPQGSLDRPEEGDSLRVYFKNDLGEWKLIRAYPGMPLQDFTHEFIAVEDEYAGAGTFFHPQFQVRFRTTGGSGTITNDNWFIDDFGVDAFVTDDIETGPTSITQFKLDQNYPNPFNPSTTINFQLPVTGKTKLVVYDVLGREIRELVNGSVTAGVKEVTWDGTNNAGVPVSSGIYIYQLTSGSFEESRKMLLTR